MISGVRALSKRRFSALQIPFRSKERLPAITITPTAADHVRSVLATHNDTATVGVRLGVRRRGCNGLSYTMNYATKDMIQPTDEVVTEHGATVYVDRQALFHLLGTQMDFVENDIGSEFVFRNPKAKGYCGCGESFNTI